MKIYKEYARHILDEIDFIDKEITLLCYDNFINNEVLKRAIVRSIEIIGEAVKNIPIEILNSFPDVEWKNIARTRDKLIHHYFGVDYEIIWDIIKNHLPNLKNSIKKILSD